MFLRHATHDASRGAVAPPSTAFPTPADLCEVDDVVLEYLLHRGFTRTFRSFALDRRQDRLRSLEVGRVVQQLFDYVYAYDLAGLHELWSFLEARFFSHLDSKHARTVNELRTRLERYYLVHAVQTDRRDRAHEYFQQRGAELHAREVARDARLTAPAHGGARGPGSAPRKGLDDLAVSGDADDRLPGNSWREWFALPYLPDPSSDPAFRHFFTPQWRDQLRLSLTNFLSLIFRAAPLPKLLLLEKWHRSESQQELKRGINRAQFEVQHLRSQLSDTQAKVSELLSATNALVSFVQQQSIETTRRLPVSGGLFEDDSAMEQRLRQLRDVGSSVVRISARCLNKEGAPAAPRAQQDAATDAAAAAAAAEAQKPTDATTSSLGAEALVDDGTVSGLVRSVDLWLRMLKSDNAERV